MGPGQFITRTEHAEKKRIRREFHAFAPFFLIAAAVVGGVGAVLGLTERSPVIILVAGMILGLGGFAGFQWRRFSARTPTRAQTALLVRQIRAGTVVVVGLVALLLALMAPHLVYPNMAAVGLMVGTVALLAALCLHPWPLLAGGAIAVLHLPLVWHLVTSGHVEHTIFGAVLCFAGWGIFLFTQSIGGLLATFDNRAKAERDRAVETVKAVDELLSMCTDGVIEVNTELEVTRLKSGKSGSLQALEDLQAGASLTDFLQEHARGSQQLVETLKSRVKEGVHVPQMPVLLKAANGFPTRFHLAGCPLRDLDGRIFAYCFWVQKVDLAFDHRLTLRPSTEALVAH